MKRALVTGASEGIGRSFAKKLALKQYVITAVARNESRLKELMRELGPGHFYKIADLSQPEGVALVEAELAMQHYDLLINNAGLASYGRFESMDLPRLQEMTRVNCDSLMVLSHSFLKSAKHGDAMINVSSTASFVPMPISSVYTATKSFVTSLSESLWYEERKRGVYVLALCPGITLTEFHTRAGCENHQIPRWLAETPDQVADTGLKALQKRRSSVVISGRQKYILWIMRLIPRQWIVASMGAVFDSALN